MQLKGYSWKLLAEYLPLWMEARFPDSEGSRFLGAIGLFLDDYLNESRNSKTDFYALRSEYREPYMIKTYSSQFDPSFIKGYLESSEVILDKVDSFEKFLTPSVTRITLKDIEEFDNNILGVNFYTEKSGFPYYTEVITSVEPFRYGSVITIDSNKAISYSRVDIKRQYYASTNGDEKIFLETSTVRWLLDNDINTDDLLYNSDKVYYTFSYKLNNKPVNIDNLVLYDAMQNEYGVKIPQDGLIVSLGTTTVYNELKPSFRTWWEIEDDYITIYNPVSTIYVIEYDYVTINGGPTTRTDSNRSVLYGDRIVLPSIINASGSGNIFDIPEFYNVTTSSTYSIDGNNIFSGSLMPSDSKMIFNLTGIISFTEKSKSKNDKIVINLYNRLKSNIDIESVDKNSFKIYTDQMTYTCFDNSDISISSISSYDDFPVIIITGIEGNININIPISITTWITMKSTSSYSYDTLTGLPIENSTYSYSDIDPYINIKKLLNVLTSFEVKLYRPILYSGIARYDRLIDKTDCGYIISDYFTSMIKVMNKNMNFIGCISPNGYTVVNNYYKVKQLDGKLGPLVAIDEIVYYIVYGNDNNNYLRSINPKTSEVKQIAILNKYMNDSIPTDITYDGEHFIIASSNKLYRFKLNYDIYIYDSSSELIYVREFYNNITIN